MNDHPNSNWLLRLASQRPFLTALAGSVLLLLCFPPIGWWPLAWVALIPFAALIAIPDFEAKRPLGKIWLAGLLYWAVATYYIAIPHPALFIAWAMLFFYLSVYPLLFVWIGRKFVHDQRMPVLLAVPVVFTALEWVRAHMLTGFGFSMLANSQYKSPIILQVCDIAGAYGLTFLLAMFASAMFCVFRGQRFRGVFVGAVIVAMVFGYGYFRLAEHERLVESNSRKLDVVVVQGSIDTRFPTSEIEARKYQEQLATDYFKLQTKWQRENEWPVPDLVVWPEGKYPAAHYLPGGNENAERARKDFRDFHQLIYRELMQNKKWQSAPTLPAMIVGTTTFDPETEVDAPAFNSALLLNQQGMVSAAYHKMHLVPFGEFIPFVEWFPFLAKATPIGSGFDAGEKPVGFKVGEFSAAPYICFESAVTHLIRESVAFLRASGTEPDLLVNVTDDGWFYGHCLLDHHLACNVMRAIENRKPVVVSSNTGISAFIQSSGQIVKQGPRRDSEVLQMELPIVNERSLYALIADWPAVAMTVMCVLAIICPSRRRVADPAEQEIEQEIEQGSE